MEAEEGVGSSVWRHARSVGSTMAER